MPRMAVACLGALLPALCILAAGGCGPDPEPPAPSSVTVSLNTPVVSFGPSGTYTFKATVTGTTNTAVTWSVQEGAAGGAISPQGVYTAPTTPGIYHIVCTSQADPSKKAVATVTVLPPVTARVTVSPSEVPRKGAVAAACDATGPDGHALTYQWTADGGTFAGDGAQVTWTAPDTLGTYNLTCGVTDTDTGTGTTVADTASVKVVNRDPKVDSVVASVTDAKPGDTVQIECRASDPDGDPLTYEWSASGGTVGGSGPAVMWTAPAAAGTCTVTGTVADGHGGSAKGSVSVTVTTTHVTIQ